MIRVYLDWQIFRYYSDYKKKKLSENHNEKNYEILDELIKNHKDKILFIYSPAHVYDLAKCYSPDNDKFFKD